MAENHALVLHARTEAINPGLSMHCGSHQGCGEKHDQHYSHCNVVSESHYLWQPFGLISLGDGGLSVFVCLILRGIYRGMAGREGRRANKGTWLIVRCKLDDPQ
jgi:hypothetical protein